MMGFNGIQLALLANLVANAHAHFLPFAKSGFNTEQVIRQDDSSVIKQEDSFLYQLYGDLLTPRGDDDAESVYVQPLIHLDPEETDEEFKEMCGWYNENEYHYPQDDFNGDLTVFSGIVSFAKTPIAQCFQDLDLEMDIAIVGAPFDTTVSYRPGARFGPNGIRQGSRRLGNGISPVRGFPGSKLRKLA